MVEGHFVLRRYRRQKYRCPCGCAPVTAPAPPRLIPGGRCSVDFAIHGALQKYCFHLPDKGPGKKWYAWTVASPSLVFCWSHVRRKYVEAEKFAPECSGVLSLIGQLYAIEADLPDPHALEGEQQGKALEHRLAVRQEKSAPLVSRIYEWALAQRALPGSDLRKALEMRKTAGYGRLGLGASALGSSAAVWSCRAREVSRR